MSGLISRVVFIRPSWDLDATRQEGLYDSRTIGLGWFLARLNTGSVQPYFCQCDINPHGTDGVSSTNHTHNGGIGRCTYNIEDDTAEDGEREVELAPRQCQVMTSYLSEHVVESRAIELLMSSPMDGVNWLGDSDGIILDIDEDFFGCEIPSDQLVKNTFNRGRDGDIAEDEGLNWADIEDLDELVAGFVCPHNADQEDTADRMLRKLLATLTTACSPDRKQDENGGGVDVRSGSTDDKDGSWVTPCQESFDSAVAATDAVLMDAITWNPSMFCDKNGGKSPDSIRQAWSSVALGLLRHLPAGRIKRRIVDSVGFCLNAAPRTLHFGERSGIGKMAVCHGANEPNSTLVYRHTPSADTELVAHFDTLDRLLSLLAASVDRDDPDSAARRPSRAVAAVGRRIPGVVTVCRSVRDGYTPRAMAMRIEANVLESTERWFGDNGRRRVAIAYDSDLLAGKRGWNGRKVVVDDDDA